MHWLIFMPLALAALWALAHVTVIILVEHEERQRRLRHPVRKPNSFKPVLIQGGKAQAPPVQNAQESKSA